MWFRKSKAAGSGALRGAPPHGRIRIIGGNKAEQALFFQGFLNLCGIVKRSLIVFVCSLVK